MAHAAVIAAMARLTGTARDLLGGVLDHLEEESFVRKEIEKARKISAAEEAAYVLGNGSRITAQDTVPFTLWVAAHHLDDYRKAITTCVQAGGDVDTTAAIVGGIVGKPPPDWVVEREDSRTGCAASPCAAGSTTPPAPGSRTSRDRTTGVAGARARTAAGSPAPRKSSPSARPVTPATPPAPAGAASACATCPAPSCTCSTPGHFALEEDLAEIAALIRVFDLSG